MITPLVVVNEPAEKSFVVDSCLLIHRSRRRFGGSCLFWIGIVLRLFESAGRLIIEVRVKKRSCKCPLCTQPNPGIGIDGISPQVGMFAVSVRLLVTKVQGQCHFFRTRLCTGLVPLKSIASTHSKNL